MARTLGSRSRAYEDRRRALILRAQARLVQGGASHASFRELAAACDVSVPTLRHYFPARDDLIVAILAQSRQDGEVHLAHMRAAISPFAASVRAALDYIAFGFGQGVGEMHQIGLTEGMGHATIGPGFVDLVLEPSLAAVRARLDRHVAAGEMRNVDTSHAALALFGPVTLFLLHQQSLGGRASHPMDLDAFLESHTDAFLRAYAL